MLVHPNLGIWFQAKAEHGTAVLQAPVKEYYLKVPAAPILRKTHLNKSIFINTHTHIYIYITGRYAVQLRIALIDCLLLLAPHIIAFIELLL